MIRVFICWSHISGYMTACWRALVATGEVDLKILGFRSNAGQTINFQDDLTRGLSCRLLDETEQQDEALILSAVAEHRPQVVVVPGWLSPAYRKLSAARALRDAKFVMTMDTPFKRDLRQQIGRFVIRSYLRRMSAIVVAGERAYQAARFMGAREEQLRRYLYAYDDSIIKPVFDARGESLPRRFLYTGRYVHEKALDVIVDAYRTYRAQVSDPWPLTCCGKGRESQRFVGVAGISDRGFVQPAELSGVLAEHGVGLLPSRVEPWGVALAEMMAAGMPCICTTAVGAGVELLRHLDNGWLVRCDDAAGLATVMTAAHHSSSDHLRAMGRRARALAESFTADIWAQRWLAVMREVASDTKATC